MDTPKLNLALLDKVQLKARGYAGSTLLKYEWDFDSKGEFVVDAEGATVTRVFRKAGTYTITVRASDKYGKKAPVSKTLIAVVNP